MTAIGFPNYDFFFASVLAAPLSAFTSTSVALIVYVMVTFDPTFTSPLTFVLESRAISHRSFPFCTAIIVSFTSRTGPVTW